MDERLNELNKSSQLRKRSNKRKKKFIFKNNLKKKNNEKLKEHFSKLNNTEIEYISYLSKLVNHICPIKDYYTIRVLLSEKTKEIICTPENVLYCEKEKKAEVERTFQEIKNANENEYININKRDNNNNNNNNINNNNNNNNLLSVYHDIADIKNETKWSDVSKQYYPYTPNHLALLSQPPNNDVNKLFDNYFYYPSSAGKDIDIYFIDIGIIVDHDDFDTSNRTITCDAISTKNDFEETDEQKKFNCTGIGIYPAHGIKLASVAGGKIHGVAKNANLHMIAYDRSQSSILKAMDYILQNAQNPNKTIINMSLGGIGYDISYDNKLTELYDAGFTVVVSAGNDNMNCCYGKDSDDFKWFSGYIQTIVVGGTTSVLYNDGHYRDSYYNYGNCVDIFAPGNVTHADLSNGSKNNYSQSEGTSYAAPIVAGVIATIMSENHEDVYNTEIIRKKLIEMAKNGYIHNIGSSNTPNRLINNGKTSIYEPEIYNAPCGSKNNQMCSDGCSSESYCLHYKYAPLKECVIGNGCQDKYNGKCISEEKAIKDCEKKK